MSVQPALLFNRARQVKPEGLLKRVFDKTPQRRVWPQKRRAQRRETDFLEIFSNCAWGEKIDVTFRSYVLPVVRQA